ncbi:hypothetical protein M8818_005136 [Zalaria obscura]|uniref:Uncharacterized protein n=1 Tax=Zalaria obscura TaxID=2024903 RepID=A0ACC3SAF0_9PEZI
MCRSSTSGITRGAGMVDPYVPFGRNPSGLFILHNSNACFELTRDHQKHATGRKKDDRRHVRQAAQLSDRVYGIPVGEAALMPIVSGNGGRSSKPTRAVKLSAEEAMHLYRVV